MMPKSTCHTSPRSGTAGILLFVKCPERRRSKHSKIIVRQIVGHRNALDNGAPKFFTLKVRKLLELAENLGDRLCHGSKIRKCIESIKGEENSQM
ncbi:MAG: hypothetical protein M3Y82_08885 [Verrucomicrobiota bacterium]|nr:hypothetical protein [Verrucomicrobiota bacterium]